MTIKGIPSTYNKDLQESVEPIIDHIKTLKDSVLIAGRVLSTLSIFPDKMLAALTPDMLATDLAEYLVRKGLPPSMSPSPSSTSVLSLKKKNFQLGLPFRETHHIAGRVVALAENEGKPMNELTTEQFQSVDSRFGADVLGIFDYERSVEMKSAVGGTCMSAIKEQIAVLKNVIK